MRVIVIDDEPNTCAFLQAAFTAEGHQCQTFVRPEEAERYLADADADLAMVDVYLGAVNGIDLLSRLRALKPDLYPVIMTAHVSVETAARSVAEGAVDYVSKPLTIEQIRAICQRARGARARKQEPAKEPVAPVHDSAIIGSSPKMLAIYKAIGRVAASNANVLITGASGTGKELVARAIHQHSKRASQPFTPVNCGSFTETILESELFGHERGAFTGANATHKGLVESSDGGTLFLDEVTETTLSFQVKLLRVIQEQQVRRVGSNKYIPVDVRIVAASNRNVPELIRQGQFREDLYYRLAVVQIAIPSLEERREDIPLLVRHFLQQFNLKNERQVSIEAEAVRRLQEMNWPGNVRELENTVNRLAIFAPTSQITRADVETETRRAQENLHPEAPVAAPDRLVELEREHIVRILKLTHGNKSEAARRLGIERKTLYKKALRLGIDLQSLEKK
ncbi:MAG TPA: sigma-54 dependent transcriptional regulator [Terriglobales bacterium]|nr:sigma-54 dependent transcriptional regulator [Terriglobales bacterium]